MSTRTLEPSSQAIVVAVDGSPESESALRWAAAHASDVGKALRIVSPSSVLAPLGEQRATAPGGEIATAAGVAIVAEQIVADDGVDEALIEQGQDASMIVLGTSSPFGARTADCVEPRQRIEDAVPCPVVLIPPDATAIDESSTQA